jgi:hypothetical protein
MPIAFTDFRFRGITDMGRIRWDTTRFDTMASFRFLAGIARRWHKPAELPLHKLSKSDGCAVL